MEELKFTKDGDKWVAEATVNKDYMLYMKKTQMAGLHVQQRQDSADEWAECDTRAHPSLNYATVCYRMSHGTYPMQVRFESDAEVVSAKVTEVEG